MSDIASLGYEIDSTQARTAAKDLDRMNAAAQKAERGAKSLKSASENLLRDEKGRFLSTAEAAGRYADEIEQLRTRYNPLYAASKQFEASQGELKRALELGAISMSQYDAAMTTLQSGMVRTGSATTQLGKTMQASSHHTTNLMYQFQDIGMMLAAGQNPLMLAVQQGTQVSGVFHEMKKSGQSAFQGIIGGMSALINPTSLLTLGVIAGGAALVQWGMSALGASEDTKSFRDNVDALESSVSAVNEISKIYTSGGLQSMVEKYGEVNAEILAMVENQKTFTINTAMADAQTAVSALRNEYSTLLNQVDRSEEASAKLTRQLGLTNEEAYQLREALTRASAAGSFEDQARELRRVNELLAKSKIANSEVAGAALDAESAMRQLANSAPASDWMSAAISGVASLGETIRKRIVEANRLRELSNVTTGSTDWMKGQAGFTLPGAELLPPEDKGGTGGTSGSGAGAGAKDPYADNLSRLVESLQTERETADAWYQENLLILEDRRAMEILGEQAHKDALIDLEKEYQAKLSGIKEQGNQWSVQSALEGGAEIFGAMAANNEKYLKAQKIFSAASALISTYEGAAKELKNGTLGFATAAAVIAKGIGFISAINGAGGGGGSGGGGGASATTSATSAAQPEQVTRVELIGDDWLVNLAESMMTQIYDASSNGRVIISKASA